MDGLSNIVIVALDDPHTSRAEFRSAHTLFRENEKLLIRLPDEVIRGRINSIVHHVDLTEDPVEPHQVVVFISEEKK